MFEEIEEEDYIKGDQFYGKNNDQSVYVIESRNCKKCINKLHLNFFLKKRGFYFNPKSGISMKIDMDSIYSIFRNLMVSPGLEKKHNKLPFQCK